MGSSRSTSKPLGRATVALQLDSDLEIMESLACAETVTDFLDICMNNSVAVPASSDPVLTQDRVLSVMLGQEEMRKVDYFSNVQPELRPHMRRIVTDWMLEVCEDQEAGTEVFLLAVHYLDTFLSSTTIRKSQFQLAAATCLLLASKFSSVVPISADQLVLYTDYSITTEELVSWELLLLQSLRSQQQPSSPPRRTLLFFRASQQSRDTARKTSQRLPTSSPPWRASTPTEMPRRTLRRKQADRLLRRRLTTSAPSSYLAEEKQLHREAPEALQIFLLKCIPAQKKTYNTSIHPVQPKQPLS